MNFLRKVFSFLSAVRTRPGFDKFFSTWQGDAIAIVLNLSTVNSNAEFHQWKDEAYRQLKERTGELKGNWIALLIGLAFEELKARDPRFKG